MAQEWEQAQAYIRALQAQGYAENDIWHAMRQAGWQVSYLDWSPAGVLGLPSKLDLQGERLRIRLVVERWSVDAVDR